MPQAWYSPWADGFQAFLDCDSTKYGQFSGASSAEAIWKHLSQRQKMARSLLSADVHIYLWCRHCKCAIEWASSFEGIDELATFVGTDPGQGKIKPDRVEESNV
jgi:hypothetical protein